MSTGTAASRTPTPQPVGKPSAASLDAVPLSVHNLSVVYGKAGGKAHTALSDVSVEVPAGSLLTLLGPSGSGKTTLLRAIAGLVEARTGTIALGERTVLQGGRAVPTQYRRLGMVFQSFALWPHMTVRKNIAYPLRLQRWRREDQLRRTDELLEQIGLVGLGERRPGELSGGQQQRVGLARAIAHRPDVLLMDEPLSNLDAQLREEMRLVIKTLQQESRLTTIYVTHDRTEALALSDSISVLRSGRIIAAGRPEDMFHEPPDAFTARFLSDWNSVAPLSEAPSRLRQSAEASRRDCKCSGRCVMMLPRETPFALHVRADEATRMLDAVVIAREFIGNLLQFDVRLAEIDATVRLSTGIDSAQSAAQPGTHLSIDLAQFRAVCAADT
jgi:ABC-type Fe3+/spermidine/putrescine transport system ATPase subunit